MHNLQLSGDVDSIQQHATNDLAGPHVCQPLSPDAAIQLLSPAPVTICSLISVPEGFEANATGRELWGPPGGPKDTSLGPHLQNTNHGHFITYIAEKPATQPCNPEGGQGTHIHHCVDSIALCSINQL